MKKNFISMLNELISQSKDAYNKHNDKVNESHTTNESLQGFTKVTMTNFIDNVVTKEILKGVLNKYDVDTLFENTEPEVYTFDDHINETIKGTFIVNKVEPLISVYDKYELNNVLIMIFYRLKDTNEVGTNIIPLSKILDKDVREQIANEILQKADKDFGAEISFVDFNNFFCKV